MTAYFTSDLHLGHSKILTFCKDTRPFDTVEEMNDAIISNINRRVTEEDDLYILGDLVWKSSAIKYLNRIAGNIHLVVGNHDHNLLNKIIHQVRLSSVSYIKNLKIGNYKVILCHYPIEDWDCKTHGSIHLHGHTHGNRSRKISHIDNRMDVGLDAVDGLEPKTLEELLSDHR